MLEKESVACPKQNNMLDFNLKDSKRKSLNFIFIGFYS